MNKLKGIAASSGIAIAKAYCKIEPDLSYERRTVPDVNGEIERLQKAISNSKIELQKIQKKAESELGNDKAAIFESHLFILNDPELINPIKEKIRRDKVNAEYALNEIIKSFIYIFEKMDNEYMKERISDIHDVTKRILSHLLGVQIEESLIITEDVIIVADDLAPSDTAQLNKKYVKGYITNIGGRTSHSAIMARSMEIPAVVGTKRATDEIQDGDMIILDGYKGEIIIDPTHEMITHYRREQTRYKQKKLEWVKLVHEQTVTSDGFHVVLEGNIGTPQDLEGVVQNGGEGIGLYRTEFLYMGRNHLPTEEEQVEFYKTVLKGMKGKSVIVRTLDIGGDKDLPYLDLPKELNPFLGLRAIRLCFEEQDIFRTQLRALLRASVYGNLKIMFPMIATIDEFQKAKTLLQEEKQSLLKLNIPVDEHIELGIMVEIPSTALMADLFAKEVDFFSVGTNDLIQYTMAADRMNERVSHLYQPYNPAILKLINLVLLAAKAEGKWVGLCGEMAEDELAIPLLIGLGMNKFSMSASSILKIRSQILKLPKTEMENMANKALQVGTSHEVMKLVKETFNKTI